MAAAANGGSGWVPPSSLEERLRALLVPDRLFVAHRARLEHRRGEPELRFAEFLAPRGRRAIDVGANIGVWSYWLARWGAQVEAFEPNPKMVAILAGARLRGVTVHAVALGERREQGRLLVPKGRRGFSNQGASLSAVKVRGPHGVAEVACHRLDDYGFSDVGFIKIDVEGGELAVLAGAQETLARCRPAMIIEIEEKHRDEPIERAISTVEGYGYRAFALLHGALTPVSEIDLERCHRQAATRADYLFNFIFLPASPPRSGN